MVSTRTFFETTLADRLMDPECFSAEIKDYLKQETAMVNAIESFIDVLIEVGCMNGRYLDWAIEHKKRYIGIDIVARHIGAGRRAVLERGLPADSCQFLLGNAEEISQLIPPETLLVDKARTLLLFPFNCFGNVVNVNRLMESLQRIDLPFFISSYQLTEYATACRFEYYKRCGYREINVFRDEAGVSFSSPDGLKTTAYHPEHLQQLFSGYGIPIKVISWSSLNLAYMRDTVFADNLIKLNGCNSQMYLNGGFPFWR